MTGLIAMPLWVRIITSLICLAIAATAQNAIFRAQNVAAGGPPPSGPTFVNGGADFTGGGTYTTSWTPTNGNTLIVWTVAADTTTTHTCSDGEGTGNTYTADGAFTPGADLAGRIFHASNISGTGAYTITCNGATPLVSVIEISGNRSLAPPSVGNNPSMNGNTSAGNITGLSVTPTTAATILIDGFASTTGSNLTSAVQVDSGFTTVTTCLTGTTCFVGGIGYRVVSSSGTYTDGWTITGSDPGWVGVLAAYQ